MKESTTTQKEETSNTSLGYENKSSLMQLFELQLKYSAEQELLVAIFDNQ